MAITLKIDGADPESIIRGLEAAQNVFDQAGFTPVECANAWGDLEWWDDSGFQKRYRPTKRQIKAVQTWCDAEKAGIAACCADWPAEKRPEAALSLVVHDGPEYFRLTPTQ